MRVLVLQDLAVYLTDSSLQLMFPIDAVPVKFDQSADEISMKKAYVLCDLSAQPCPCGAVPALRDLQYSCTPAFSS
jgi:hypothetical protein